MTQINYYEKRNKTSNECRFNYHCRWCFRLLWKSHTRYSKVMFEEIMTKLEEFDNTKDLQRKKILASEIANETSDPDLIREMEEYIKFYDTFFSP